VADVADRAQVLEDLHLQQALTNRRPKSEYSPLCADCHGRNDRPEYAICSDCFMDRQIQAEAP